MGGCCTVAKLPGGRAMPIYTVVRMGVTGTMPCGVSQAGVMVIDD